MADLYADTLAELRTPAPAAGGAYDATLAELYGTTRPAAGQAGEGSFISEVGKGIAQGAVSATASAGKGMAAADELDKADRTAKVNEAIRAIETYEKTGEMPEISFTGYQDFIDSYLQAPDPAAKDQIKAALQSMAGIHITKPVTQNEGFQSAQALQKWGEQKFQAAKDYENSWTRAIAEGLGSLGPVIAASLMTKGGGGVLGINMSTGEAVDNAIKAGASQEDILRVTSVGTVPGATESLPWEGFLKKIPLGQWGRAMDIVVKIGSKALEEGGQEALQQFMQNLITKYTYDPDKPLTEDMLQSFVVGAVVGGIAEAPAAPFTTGGEPATPPAGTPPPPPANVPPGSLPAETILPPEPEAVADAVQRPDSPRLTPEDRKSPIPNDILDDGKALVEAATGQPSTVVTTEEIDGQTTVVQKPVAEIVAENRAQTADLIEQITATVDQPELFAAAMEGAPPVSEAPVGGAVAPTEAPVPPAPAVAEAEPRPRYPALDEMLKAEQQAWLTDQGFTQEQADALPPEEQAQLRSEFEARNEPAPAPVAEGPQDFSNMAHPRSEDTKDFNEWVGKVKEFGKARAAYAAQLVASSGGKGIRMVSKDRPNKKVLVGPDMTEADRGKFRVTYVDEHGPSGHMVYNTFEEATEEAVKEGYVPAQPTGPAAQESLKTRMELNRAATAETPVQRPKIEVRPIRDDVAITPTGRDVPVQYAVVEADSLIASQRDEGGTNPDYPQELQPRDRSRAMSDTQIADISSNLDPRLLDQNPNASDGAPIISDDGVVESGNGRVLAIRRALLQNMPSAAVYRDYLAKQGYPIEGMQNPVLVRVRQGDMQDRAAFTREANQRTTLEMSEPEQAMADAAAMKPSTIGLYRGGEVEDAGNRDFVRSFHQSVVGQNEQAVTAKGELSQKAIRRIRAALLARAYGAADLVSALVESTDNNIKAIGGALMDVAGQWAQMRSEAADGSINPDVDVTPYLLEAVRLVQRARTEGRPLAEFVAQNDIFSGTTIVPEAEMLLRLMFRNNASWTQPVGREKLAEALSYFVTEARKTTPGIDLLGEAAPPAHKILGEAKKRQYGTEETQAALALGGRTPSQDNGAPAGKRAVEAKPGSKPAGGKGVSAKDGKAKLAAKVAAKRAEKQAALRGKLPAEFELKGRVGDFAFGYMPGKDGGRNNWQVVRKSTGEVVLRNLENHSAAAVGAQRSHKAEENAPARDAARQAALSPKPKFSLLPRLKKDNIVVQETGEEVLKRPDGLTDQEWDDLYKELTSPEITEAIARMKAVPPTDKQPGYGTAKWWANRVYNFGTPEKPVNVRGQEEAVPLLVERARNLAVKEINEGRAKSGKPLIESYTPARNRKMIIIIGAPAAGKSSIANPIAVRERAAIADVDDAKTVIPEYYQPDPKTGEMKGGIGANAVHEESSILGQAVLERLLMNGDNIVIPKVGHKLDSMEKLRADAVRLGYTVELHQMDVSAKTALARMIKRFKRTGRLINPAYFLDVVLRPGNTYNQAKKAGKFDGYARITSEDDGPTRVSEATGGTQSVARGEVFNRDGTIGSSGRTEGRRPDQRAQDKLSERLQTGEVIRQATQQFDKGTVTYQTTEKFADKATQVLADLRRILDGYGLKDITLRVWEKILVNQQGAGTYSPAGAQLHDLIDVALTYGGSDKQLTDAEETLHHEVVHALLLHAATVSEKNILFAKSKRDWITQHIKESYPEEDWAEEGVAFAYTEWLNGQKFTPTINRIFQKFTTFLKSIYQALTNHDIRTAEDVFRQMQSGKIGSRTQQGKGGKAKFAKPQGGLFAEDTVDLFGGQKGQQSVIPGAEKITQAQLAQRKADAPMRSTRNQQDTDELPLFSDGKKQLSMFHIPASPGGASATPPPPRMTQPPHNAAQASAAMQGFLARGQPIDRSIRVLFSLLGGLDAQNRWTASKRLSDRYKITPQRAAQRREGAAIGGILGAGVGTILAGPGVGTYAGAFAGGTVGAFILGGPAWTQNGSLRWFRSFAENAKRGLITNYGLDPEYIETFRKSDLWKNAKLREGAEHLKVLHNAGVGPKEAQVIQQILSGEPVSDADMSRLAAPIRKAIDDMGAEAVSYGLISAESFERNRGAYLHRVYLKNEADQSDLSGWVAKKMSSKRKRIIGDELKGRGMFMDQPAARIMQDVDSFKSGARGTPVLGEKFKILDEVSATPNLTPDGKSTEKVLRRVYLPANEAIPAKYQGANWKDQGTWEVRKEGKTTTLWRDYSKDERSKMGEIIDARYTIAKTFMLLAHDLATGKFYHDIAFNSEWTRGVQPPDGTWKEGGEYNVMNGRYWEDPDIQWVKVPDTNIEKSGGKKKWGALAGKWIRSEIWRDINELNLTQNPGTWRVIYRQWKANHTYRHPVVHMNNVMSNVLFMDMADVRGQDLVGGLKSYLSGDKNYQEALDNGAFGAGVVSQEIRDKVLKPILDEITKQSTGATNPFLAKTGMAGVVADKLWSWAKSADNGMMRAYEAEDEIYRMALYMRRRSQGESPQAAAAQAREQFLNYDIRAPWVVALRNTALPFIGYTYRAVPQIMHSLQLRPWKIAKYAAIAYAVNALSYMLDDWGGGDDGEDKERAALRDEEQGRTWLGIPRMVRMPWRDSHGLPVFFDMRRWIPAGDVFDATQGSSALPIPSPLQFGGPMQLAYEFMLNKKAFDGKEITEDLTMTPGEKVGAVADWAWKAWTPPSFWNPGSHYWSKISNALYGAKDSAGNVYSLPQAALSAIGIKVKAVDVEDGIKWHYVDFMKVQDALKKQMASNSRDLDRGIISQSAHDAKAAKIMEKFGNLGQSVDEFSKRAAGKQRAK